MICLPKITSYIVNFPVAFDFGFGVGFFLMLPIFSFLFNKYNYYLIFILLIQDLSLLGKLDEDCGLIIFKCRNQSNKQNRWHIAVKMALRIVRLFLKIIFYFKINKLL